MELGLKGNNCIIIIIIIIIIIKSLGHISYNKSYQNELKHPNYRRLELRYVHV